MASKPSLPPTNYQTRLKKLLNEPIVDIILFGSLVKGGLAKDVDVAIVLKSEADLSRTKKQLAEIFKKPIDTQPITIESLYSPLWLTLIKEGWSVKKERFLYELYNIKPMTLYKYSLASLTNTQKVQFERGIKNVLKNEGTYLSRAVVLIPLHLKNAMMDFLKTWNIYYETQEYELLPLLRKEELT